MWLSGAWVAFIGNADNDSYTPPLGGDNGGVKLSGIDHFAWACRHEDRHVQTLSAWYPSGYNGAIDQDGDLIPDSLETTFGGPEGGPFNPATRDTDGDGMRDGEDYTVATQSAWSKGAADAEDWASPGHQSNQ